jgi:hypothetical protein
MGVAGLIPVNVQVPPGHSTHAELVPLIPSILTAGSLKFKSVELLESYNCTVIVLSEGA